MRIGRSLERSRSQRIATVALVALLAASCNGDDDGETDVSTTVDVNDAESGADDAATGAPSTSTDVGTAAAPEDDSTSHVIDFYTVLGQGDMDAMVEIWPSADVEHLALLVDGVRERAFVVCAPAGERGVVVCEETVGNDFLDPAGVEGAYTVEYGVDQGSIVAWEIVEIDDAVIAYQEAVAGWLEANDPELLTTGFSGTSGKYPFERVAHAQAVINALDSFLADSSVYPLPDVAADEGGG